MAKDLIPIGLYQPVTDTSGLGSAMIALEPKQRAFILAYVDTGGRDGSRAAALAGYGNTPDSHKAAAYRLLHDEKILRAIKEVADARLRSGALLGTEVLIEIAQDPTHKDRMKAATRLLDQAGLIVIQKTQHEHTHMNVTDEDRIKRVVALSKQLGLDAQQLLGSAGVVVDAEFKVVKDGKKPHGSKAFNKIAAGLKDATDIVDAEFGSADGLEDLL